MRLQFLQKLHVILNKEIHAFELQLCMQILVESVELAKDTVTTLIRTDIIYHCYLEAFKSVMRFNPSGYFQTAFYIVL